MARYRRKVDRNAVALASVLGVVAFVALGAIWWMVGGASPYDGVDTKTFCRITGHRSITVVLVDATDPFTQEQGERLLNELKRVRDAVPRFGEFDLFAIDSTKTNGIGAPLVRACNPGNAADADRFRENARIVGKQYSNLFDAPFQTALNRVLGAGMQSRSPIIESIEAATTNVFGALPQNADVEKHFIIISDMLQNTDALTFYGGSVPQFPEFLGTDAFRMHRPSLTGVDVAVWEINRPKSSTPARRSQIARFWADYFSAEHATLSSTYWDATRI